MQTAPLSARIKELEEEVARVVGKRDAAREETKREAATAQTYREDLVTLSTARQQQEEALTEARQEAALVPTLCSELDALKAAYQQRESALTEAKATVEMLQGEASEWRQKAEGKLFKLYTRLLPELPLLPPRFLFCCFVFVELEKELADKVAASASLQTTFDTEAEEHTALQGVIRSLCDALEVDGGSQVACFGAACMPSTTR